MSGRLIRFIGFLNAIFIMFLGGIGHADTPTTSTDIGTSTTTPTTPGETSTPTTPGETVTPEVPGGSITTPALCPPVSTPMRPSSTCLPVTTLPLDAEYVDAGVYQAGRFQYRHYRVPISTSGPSTSTPTTGPSTTTPSTSTPTTGPSTSTPTTGPSTSTPTTSQYFYWATAGSSTSIPLSVCEGTGATSFCTGGYCYDGKIYCTDNGAKFQSLGCTCTAVNGGNCYTTTTTPTTPPETSTGSSGSSSTAPSTSACSITAEYGFPPSGGTVVAPSSTYDVYVFDGCASGSYFDSPCSSYVGNFWASGSLSNLSSGLSGQQSSCVSCPAISYVDGCGFLHTSGAYSDLFNIMSVADGDWINACRAEPKGGTATIPASDDTGNYEIIVDGPCTFQE